MPVLTWDESYSVGVRKIDNEHKLLIAMINKAYDSVNDQDDQDALRELADDMRGYAKSHFATEADFMVKYDYPGIEEHRRKHNDFMLHAAPTAKLFSNEGQDIDPLKVFKYLAEWLSDHIQETDKELGAFLNEKGVE